MKKVGTLVVNWIEKAMILICLVCVCYRLNLIYVLQPCMCVKYNKSRERAAVR